MDLIDKTSPIPYYEQLAELLRNEIRSNAPDRGEKYPLPSENLLATRHGITRTTVRHALDKLERQGWIYREKGKGTFAVPRPGAPAHPRMLSTSEYARLHGWALATRLISLVQIPADIRIAQALATQLEAPVLELKRLRSVEAGPLCLQTAYVRLQIVPNLEENDLTESLSRILETHYGLRLWTAQETLQARSATAAEARLLQIRPGKPVMASKRVIFTANGAPVEYLETVWRSDRYNFNVLLSKTPT